jgi:hypothetical protein
MSTSSLQDFITTTTATSRITFGDVRRLRRAILPEGLIARDEVEALLDLDATVARRDPSWTDWLVAAVVDFAVWGERPTGFVEGEAAAWLGGLLSRHGMATKAARRIAREIEREAEAIDQALADLASDAANADRMDATDGDSEVETGQAYDGLDPEAMIEPAIAAAALARAAL